MTKAVWSPPFRIGAFVLVALSATSCGDVVRQGQGSSYLVVTTLEGASGAQPSTFSTVLASDVVTVVGGAPIVFEDPGRIVLTLAMKDIGTPDNPVTPSPNNFITVNRYRVVYRRADGRNTEGVDVPYAFDGAVTATISSTTAVGFTLVRVQAKEEAPLRALRVNGDVISTIAEVTFYGRDQTGREVAVSAQMSINFANWGDS